MPRTDLIDKEPIDDPTLSKHFSDAPCTFCQEDGLPTFGPTYHDSETNADFCLACLVSVTMLGDDEAEGEPER